MQSFRRRPPAQQGYTSTGKWPSLPSHTYIGSHSLINDDYGIEKPLQSQSLFELPVICAVNNSRTSECLQSNRHLKILLCVRIAPRDQNSCGKLWTITLNPVHCECTSINSCRTQGASPRSFEWGSDSGAQNHLRAEGECF